MKHMQHLLQWQRGLSRFRIALTFVPWACLMFSVLMTFQAEAAARPGKNDPMGNPSRRSLFPDHEIMAFVPGDGNVMPVSYGLDQNWPWFHEIASQPAVALSTPQIAAAAGRIVAEKNDQVVYAKRIEDRAGVFVLQPALSKTVQSAALAKFALPPEGCTEFLDLAVGDLDNLADTKGQYHDEVVVCYATQAPEDGKLTVNVAVLDYTDRLASKPRITTRMSSTRIFTTSFAVNTVGKINPTDNVVACAVGDLNGDGKNEIALAHLVDEKNIAVSVFRYSKDKKGNPTLQEVSKGGIGAHYSNLGGGQGFFGGSLDLVAGDFNGDGDDDLAVAVPVFADLESTWFNPQEAHPYAELVFVESDPDFVLQTVGVVHQRTDSQQCLMQFPVRRIQAVTGLFRFDPGNGYGFGRRQVAMVFQSPPLLDWTGMDESCIDGGLTVDFVTTYNGWSAYHGPVEVGRPTGDRFSVEAGNFSGYVEGSAPLWSLAIGSWDNDGVYRLTAVGGPRPGAVKEVPMNIPAASGARPALVAYDHDGDSVYLGAPVHITIPKMVRTDFIVQEPPKHLAYLNGKIVNVSRDPNFYVELMEKNQYTYSTKSTDKTDFGFGASLQATAKQTVGGAMDIGIYKGSVEFSLQVTAMAGYDYAAHKEGYNSSYAERTATYTGQTNYDDYLVYQTQLFDIWRYRAYGVKTGKQGGKQTYGFYEIVFPGPAVEARGGGKGYDWYQPLHENGNILSYPVWTKSSSKPPDLGSFEQPDGSMTREPLIPATLLSFGGASEAIVLTFTNTSGEGKQLDYSHTLNASLDVGVSGKVDVQVWGVKSTTEMSANASLKTNKSWASLATSDTTSSTSFGITLNKPASGDPTTNYPFAPLAYITQDGTLKVTHTVGELNGVDSWWQEKFGQKPDPALNLPNRFICQDTDCKANSRAGRKQMRGFFVCQPDASASAPCLELSRQPAAGDKVRLFARVYNYSTAKTARDLTVRFEAVAYDQATNKEVGKRKILGQTKIASLGPRQMTQASFNWDTTGFGPGAGKAVARYRIYVVLDPLDTIDEVYETEPKGTIDPGQNNEGWGMISVTAPSAAGTLAARSAVPSSNSPATEAIREVDSVTAMEEPDGKPATGSVVATLGEPLPVRVHVSSPQDDPSTYRLLVFAQPPGQPEQREVVAGKLIQGLDAQDGAYVWVEWVPKEVGDVELQAVLEEDALDHGEVPPAARLMVHVDRPATR